MEKLAAGLSQLGGGDSIVGMDGECTHLAEAVSDPVSSEAHLAPGLVGRGWSGIPGNLLLNLLTIVDDAVMSFWNM